MVVHGAKRMSSWSRPIILAPRLLRAPITTSIPGTLGQPRGGESQYLIHQALTPNALSHDPFHRAKPANFPARFLTIVFRHNSHLHHHLRVRAPHLRADKWRRI